LRSLMAKVKGSEDIVLFCHQNADPDAVCSALGLQTILRRLVPGARIDISCPGGVGASTKQLLENLGVTVPSEEVPVSLDLAVLVDTNTLDQLGKTGDALLKSAPDLVVVDHHHPHPDTEKIASLMIVDESAAAAAEVVFELAKAGRVPLGRLEATALLAALFVETKHFLLARKSTFLVAAELVEAGADPRRISEMLSSPMSRSERIARLKAATRGQVILLGSWIVVTSELGSYQSSAARSFLGLGAHLAMVGGETKDKIRINMRATEEFHNKTGVHLGRDVAIPLGKQLGGAGGGHPTAAGLSAQGEAKNLLRTCVERVRECLGPLQT